MALVVVIVIVGMALQLKRIVETNLSSKTKLVL